MERSEGASGACISMAGSDCPCMRPCHILFLSEKESEGVSMYRSELRNPGTFALFCSVIVGGLASPPVNAADMSHGEMAGAIRGADYPCAQVLKVDNEGENAWIVRCNSGTFSVSRDQDDGFKVSQIE